MPRELSRDVLRGRRVARQVGEHCTPLLGAGFGIAFAEHCFFAGLVEALVEQKLATVRRIGRSIQVQPVNTLAKLVTSVWRIAAVDAKRVQLEVFAGEIFV